MGMMDKLAGIMNFGGNDDDDDEYEGYENEYADETESQTEPREEEKTVKPVKKQVTPQKRRSPLNESEVCIFKPQAFDEAREIVETLIDGKTVLLNFEGIDLSISQRVLDVITGACIAENGNLQKISNYIFIATPSSVDVSGATQDTLLSPFDI